MRRSGSGSPPAGRGGKKPVEVSLIPAKKPVTTEVEQTAVAGKSVAAEVERAAAGEKMLAAELERTAAGQQALAADVERAAVVKPVVAKVEGASAVAKPMEDTAASGKPVAAEIERASGGEKPAVAEGWERLARELWDPKVQSKFWLEVFSLATDAWLRSGAFLEFMQYGLQAAIGESSRDRGSMNSGAEPFGEVGGTPRDPSASRKDKKL